MKLISELPEEVRKIAERRRKDYALDENEYDNLLNAFSWVKTPEKHHIWNEIYCNDNFEPFYTFHKIKREIPTNTEGLPIWIDDTKKMTAVDSLIEAKLQTTAEINDVLGHQMTNPTIPTFSESKSDKSENDKSILATFTKEAAKMFISDKTGIPVNQIEIV